MVGVVSVCVDYALMMFLVEFAEVNYFAASAFSYIFSVFVNYILSMRFVFRGRENVGKGKEVIIYFMLSFIGLGLNQMIMLLAVDLFGLYYGIAKWFATILVGWYNFISRKKCME
jgi:putative flippase GtrA